MKIDTNFKFKVSYSDENFLNKEISNAMIGTSKSKANREIRKRYGYKRGVSFRRHETNSAELLNLLLEGKVFCHNFRPHPLRCRKDKSFGASGKCDACFDFADVIGVDIDYTLYKTVEEYIERLSLKPTFWYTSYSHMTYDEKQKYIGPKFRMIYVFEEHIRNPYWFRWCAKNLIDIIEKDTGESVKDKCGLLCSQYFNGTNIKTCEGVEFGVTHRIYNLADLGVDEPTTDTGFFNYLISCCDYSNHKAKYKKEIKKILDRLTDKEYFYNPATKTFETRSLQEREIINDIDLIDDFVITDIDLNQLKFETQEILSLWDKYIDEQEKFMKTRVWELARQKTRNLYRIDKNKWEMDRYQVVDRNYFRLPYYFKKRHDKEHRRKTLYSRMCLRRVMSPNINRDEIVINTIRDIIRFFDNSDHVLNSNFIIRNVESCFNNSVQEIEEKFKDLIDEYRSDSYPIDGMIYKNKECHSRETKFLILDEYYNGNYTLSENLEYMNQVLWFNVSQSLLYEYLKNRGISTDPSKVSDEILYDLLDASLSVRKNIELLHEKGVKFKRERLCKLLKQKKSAINLPCPDI